MAHKKHRSQVEKESLEERGCFIFLNRGQFSHFHSILRTVNNAASPDTDTKRLGFCDYKIDQWAYLSQFPIFHLLLCLMKSWENIWPFSSPIIHLLFQLHSKCVLHFFFQFPIYFGFLKENIHLFLNLRTVAETEGNQGAWGTVFLKPKEMLSSSTLPPVYSLKNQSYENKLNKL